MTEAAETTTLAEQLQNFYGTEEYHRLSLIPIVATDGVKYFADKGKACWAVDEVLMMYKELVLKGKISNGDFVVFKIKSKNNKASIKAEDGDGGKLKSKNIQYTDLEEGEYKFYVLDEVILLPSEY